MLVIHQAFNLVIDIPSRDSNGRLRSNKRLSGAAPCELEGDFISTYPGLSKDPVQPHGVPGRDIIQRLLALFSQWRRCFGSLVCFQSRLAIRASTNISLVYTDFQFHKRRLISHIPQPERLYHVFLEEYWAFFLRIAHRSQHRYPPPCWTHLYIIRTNYGRSPRFSGPLLRNQHSNPVFGFKIESGPHNIDLHAKYGIKPLNPRQYTAMSSIGLKPGPISLPPKATRR